MKKMLITLAIAGTLIVNTAKATEQCNDLLAQSQIAIFNYAWHLTGIATVADKCTIVYKIQTLQNQIDAMCTTKPLNLSLVKYAAGKCDLYYSTRE